VAQRAIVMLREPIYEQDFRDCSFGFRAGRNAHQVLRVIRHGIVGQGVRWVLEVDVRKYFDSIDHAKLRELLARRVTDGVVRRMIDKWLKAGVLERGQVSFPGVGTPQGGVISPVLSNVFWHYVLDEWFAEQVQPRLRNGSVLVRYCDDFVMLFASKDDAERVQAVLGKRLAKFGLELNPTKTRLVDFRPPAERAGAETTLPTTFTFFGFLRLVARYPLPATDPVDLRTTHPPHAASGRRCVSDCEWRNGSGRPLRLSSTSWHSTRVGAAQNLAELDIDFAAIKQAAGWRSPRMPLQFAEKINVARSGMARAAAAAGRDEPVF
jgi:hypothetical protein